MWGDNMSQKSYSNNKATLFLIPTPIGNMEDITIRAINTLKEVEVIFSEDTRVTKQLLNYLGISKKLISSHFLSFFGKFFLSLLYIS